MTFEAGCKWQVRNWSASCRPLTDGDEKPRAVAREAWRVKGGLPSEWKRHRSAPGYHGEENADEMLMGETAGRGMIGAWLGAGL